MPLKPAAELPQRHAFFHVKVSRVRKGGIEHGADMAVTEDEPVALLPLRPLRVVLQDMEIKRGEDVRHAEGPRRVSAPCIDQHLYDRLADSLRALL